MKNDNEKKEINFNKFNWTDFITMICCILVIGLNIFMIVSGISSGKETASMTSYIMACFNTICWCAVALMQELRRR